MTASLPRRNAILDRHTPAGRPVFRVRSRRSAAAYLVVVQPDGRALCNCEAASYGSPCYHASRAAASFARRSPRERARS